MKQLLTLDCETDPFLAGRIPTPFAWGLYDGETFEYTWGKDCTADMMTVLYNTKPSIIYIHNGGKFDVYFMMDYLINEPMRIINGRIVKAKLKCAGGFHEIRDSYAILPIALKRVDTVGGKLEIEYALMEAGEREKHRKEIVTYLKRDVVFLHRLVSGFVGMFGLQLTIGTTAMKELQKLHTFEKLSLSEDKPIRRDYYYGGRVECFESGIIDGSFKVYDVNSMYPYAMKTSLHPIGRSYFNGSTITGDTCFITATGTNYGAFPFREKNGSLNFSKEYGTFHVTRHEWDVAEELGLFRCDKILAAHNYDSQVSFAEFVDKFYSLRMGAQARGDEIEKLFFKLILNSAYGKFAQSSENYCEYRITDLDTDLHSIGWKLNNFVDTKTEWKEQNKFDKKKNRYLGQWLVWERPSLDENMYNVATGCSITGSARALLLRGLHSAKRPIYCDTDSIICENLPSRNTKDLGDWKLEAKCDRAAIAGKKLYALFDGPECVKQASKGVNISPAQILEVCQGGEVESVRESPSFKLDGLHVFISRKIRMTI